MITGHRGLVEAMMFTRLDEMRVGDYFYIEVMGRTLGYKVDRISVIEPNDTSTLKIVPGEDRVTLMTCTPYGVNTHRLLVSAVRSAIPGVVPEERNAAKDARTIAIATAVATLLLGSVAGLAAQTAVAYSQTCGLGGRNVASRCGGMLWRHPYGYGHVNNVAPSDVGLM